MLSLFYQASLTLLAHHINCLLGTPVPQLSLQGSSDDLEMVGFAVFSTFLPISRTLLGCISCPTVLAFVTAHGLIFMFLGTLPYGTKFLGFLNTVQCNSSGLCTSTLCTQVNMCSLVASSMSFNIATSFNI